MMDPEQQPLLPHPAPAPPVIDLRAAEKRGQRVIDALALLCALASAVLGFVFGSEFSGLAGALGACVLLLGVLHLAYLSLYKAAWGDPYTYPMAPPDALNAIDKRITGVPDAARIAASEDCPCPFVRVMYAQGAVAEADVSPMGYVSQQNMLHVMDWAGVSRFTFKQPSFNHKFHTSGVPILHLAMYLATALELNAHWVRFQSYANMHGEYGLRELAAMVHDNCARYRGGADELEKTEGEMATMLTVFGHANGSWWRRLTGLKVLTLEDVHALWVLHAFPPGWLARRRAETRVFSLTSVAILLRIFAMKALSLLGGRITTDPMPNAFRPFPSPRRALNEPEPPTPEDIGTVPGGRLSLYDSRAGGVQAVPPLWVFDETQWQVPSY